MTPKIDIIDKDEDVFLLKSIGIDAELCMGEEGNYITTPDAYFLIKDIKDFREKDGNFYILNEEGDILSFTKEQYDIISCLFGVKNI
jgi:hypothetical protein